MMGTATRTRRCTSVWQTSPWKSPSATSGPGRWPGWVQTLGVMSRPGRRLVPQALLHAMHMIMRVCVGWGGELCAPRVGARTPLRASHALLRAVAPCHGPTPPTFISPQALPPEPAGPCGRRRHPAHRGLPAAAARHVRLRRLRRGAGTLHPDGRSRDPAGFLPQLRGQGTLPGARHALCSIGFTPPP